MIYENEAQVFYALAHPVRLEILELLRGGEACVCHIQAMLGQRQAYISQHLNVLRKAGLVSSRKDGQRVYYQVSNPDLYAVIDDFQSVMIAAGILETRPAEVLPRNQEYCRCPQCASQTAG